MRIMLLALMCLLYLAPMIRAEVGKSQDCENYRVWNVLPESVIAEEGLTEKVRTIEQTIASVRAVDLFKRDITVAITDCPVFGYHIRASARMNISVLAQAMGYRDFPQDYDVFITLGELRNMTDDDAVQTARQQSCLIHGGVADDRYRQWDNSSRGVIECRLNTAEAMGDTEEAKWFSRLLENPLTRAVLLAKKPQEPKARKKHLK